MVSEGPGGYRIVARQVGDVCVLRHDMPDSILIMTEEKAPYLQQQIGGLIAVGGAAENRTPNNSYIYLLKPNNRYQILPCSFSLRP